MALTSRPAIGDTVKLNSGGPVMTVDGIRSDSKVIVTWFTENGDQGGATFAPEMLTLHKPEK